MTTPACASLIPLDHDLALDAWIVGHKFANLARSCRHGQQVPKAACLPVECHAHYQRHGSWVAGLEQAVLRTARDLGLDRGGVAVRSSATLEDLEGLSFAGQYTSILQVRDDEALLRAVETCWQAVDQEAIRRYLEYRDLQGRTPRMGVIIQAMIQAEFAGVVFSRNPVAGGPQDMIAEIVAGMGEHLVSGKETPIRCRLSRAGKVLERSLPSRAAQPPEHLCSRLAGLTLLVEDCFSGQAVDIEWAVDKSDVLWLLQARPITTGRYTQESAPSGIWTRKIADDLWADRLTPFMADHMVRSSRRFDLTRHAQRLKIAVPRPTLGVIDGFLYVNCSSLSAVLSLLPGRFRTWPVRELFPAEFDLDSIEQPSLLRMTLLGLRALWLSVRVPGSHPLFCSLLTRAWLKRFNTRLHKLDETSASGSDPAGLLDRAESGLNLLAELQERNQFPYMYATVLTWWLHWLTVERGKLDGTSFWSGLSSGSDNVTVTMERDVRSLARTIRDDARLRQLLADHGPEEALPLLPEGFRNDLHSFLERYGVRARHRTLLVPRWKESPEEVLSLVWQLARQEGTGHDARRHRLEVRQPFFLWRPLFGLARRYLDQREELRFSLDHVLFLLRQTLLELGEQSGLGRAVFFLTRSEIRQVIQGQLSAREASALSRERETASRGTARPARFMVHGRPAEGAGAQGQTLTGTGTSPGRAGGRARIVHEPSAADLVEGDILIAEHTDPGWTPVLDLVGGVVTEEGGMLNHCSIVARELGIPAVVGIENATRLISEGAFVLVDGAAGTVHVEPDGDDGEVAGDEETSNQGNRNDEHRPLDRRLGPPDERGGHDPGTDGPGTLSQGGQG